MQAPALDRICQGVQLCFGLLYTWRCGMRRIKVPNTGAPCGLVDKGIRELQLEALQLQVVREPSSGVYPL